VIGVDRRLVERLCDAQRFVQRDHHRATEVHRRLAGRHVFQLAAHVAPALHRQLHLPLQAIQIGAALLREVVQHARRGRIPAANQGEQGRLRRHQGLAIRVDDVRRIVQNGLCVFGEQIRIQITHRASSWGISTAPGAPRAALNGLNCSETKRTPPYGMRANGKSLNACDCARPHAYVPSPARRFQPAGTQSRAH